MTTYNPKNCAVCKAGGSIRKWKLYFSYNKSAKVCVFCLQKLNGPNGAVEWLGKNAIYASNGQLIDFQKEAEA